MKFTSEEYKKIVTTYITVKNPKRTLREALSQERYAELPNVCKYRRAKNIVDEAINHVTGAGR